MTGKLQVIVGGQYGSEAKGAIAGRLAQQMGENDLAVRIGGPNAGHSVVHPTTGETWALRQVPVAAVTNPQVQLHIAAGSEIDLEVLSDEVYRLEHGGVKVRHRLTVDPSATIIQPRHLQREADDGLVGRVGSTGKGVGAARADRTMRTAATYGELGESRGRHPMIARHPGTVLGVGNTVQIEAVQGYGLGLHTIYYPQVTSIDCTAQEACALAGIAPWAAWEVDIWVVFRPNPIRVAGNSGPLRGETSWAKLGLDPEYTTVTQKLRRVGEWDPALFRRAIEVNRPSQIALTMADHIDPGCAGATEPNGLTRPVWEYLDRLRAATNCTVSMVGTSPSTQVDLRGWAW